MREYQPPPAMPRVSAGSTRWLSGAVAAERKPAQRDRRRHRAAVSPTTNCGVETRDEGQRHRHLVGRCGRGGWRHRSRPGKPIISSARMAPSISSRVAGRRRAISVADIALAGVGVAEIATGRGVRQIAQILHRQRPVEAELVADLLATVWAVALRPAIMAHRIGRDHEGEGEGDDGHAEQDQKRCDEPSREIADHPLRPRWVGSRASRRPSPTRLKERARIRIAAPGNEDQPGRAEEIGLALEDDHAPGGRRRLHADGRGRTAWPRAARWWRCRASHRR